jgi:hypothetical protein
LQRGFASGIDDNALAVLPRKTPKGGHRRQAIINKCQNRCGICRKHLAAAEGVVAKFSADFIDNGADFYEFIFGENGVSGADKITSYLLVLTISR